MISETQARKLKARQLMKRDLLAPKVELILHKLKALGASEDDVLDLTTLTAYHGFIEAINQIYEIND